MHKNANVVNIKAGLEVLSNRMNTLSGQTYNNRFERDGFAAAQAGRYGVIMGIAKCSWCGKFLGLRENLPPGVVTHGICDECMSKIENEYEEYKEANESD